MKVYDLSLESGSIVWAILHLVLDLFSIDYLISSLSITVVEYIKSTLYRCCELVTFFMLSLT